MQKIIRILSVLLSSSIVYAQKSELSDLEVKYNMKFVIDTTDVSNTTVEERISLLIGNDTSLFKSDAKKKSDSIAWNLLENSHKAAGEGKAIINLSTAPRYSYFRETYKKSDKIYIYSKIVGTVYRFEPLYKVNWKILSETKNINGILCKKAEGKYGDKNVIAWFAESIPITEGPYVFKNLPGLVVDVYDDKEYFRFTMLSLKKSNLPIQPIKSYVDTSYQKYMDKRNELRNDPAGSYYQVLGKQMTNERQKDFKQGFKKMNNVLD
ncbi:GLPGLI family protein [uncultured Chryseobacterium sp.]|uniref:GLPGLI family protein n=1 Tax=uncultured Chryseobacterium sp. TaxID=259322 RepID=UPI00258EFDB6|nr:GLPGLI family protein [uncultured Chryseobacterium sp.]